MCLYCKNFVAKKPLIYNTEDAKYFEVGNRHLFFKLHRAQVDEVKWIFVSACDVALPRLWYEAIVEFRSIFINLLFHLF
jgi:hypothetical protein